MTFHSGSGGAVAMELSDQNASYAIILSLLAGNIKQPGIKLQNFGGISIQKPTYTSGMDRPVFGLQMTKPYSTFGVSNSSVMHDSDWVGTGITHPGPVGAQNFTKGLQIGHVVHFENNGGPTMGFYADLNSTSIGSSEVHAFRAQLGGFNGNPESFSNLLNAGHRNDTGTTYGMEIEFESTLSTKSGSYGLKIDMQQDANGAAGQYDYLIHTDFGSSYQQGSHVPVALRQSNTAGGQAYGIWQSGIVYNTFAGTSTFPNITITDSLALGATDKLYFDGSHSGNTYIYEQSADALHFVIGGTTILELDENGSAANNWMAIQATNKFYLDGGSDTYITEAAANRIEIAASNYPMLSIKYDQASSRTLIYRDLYINGALQSAGSGDTLDADYLRFHNNGSNSYIDFGSGNLYIRDESTTRITITDGTGMVTIAQDLTINDDLFVGDAAHIDALHVGTGTDTDPGDGNAKIDGNLTVDGNIYINGISDAAGLPKFLVRRTSDTSALSSNTWTTIAFNSEDFDTGSDYNTSNGIFSAPAAGYYHFSWQIRFQNMSTATDYIWTKLNTTDEDILAGLVRIDDFANATIAYWQTGGSATVHLDAGDTVKVQALQVSSTTSVTVDGSTSNYQSWFTGHMVI